MLSIMHTLLLSTFIIPSLSEQAYLDPGSGSFLIQLLIGGLVSVGFLVKFYWKKIKGLFQHSSDPMESDIKDESLK